LVRLSRADDAAVGPDGSPHPLPLFDDLRVSLVYDLAHFREHLAAPVPKFLDLVVDQCSGRFRRSGPFHPTAPALPPFGLGSSIPWVLPLSHASTLRAAGRPTGGLDAELLCVLGVQSLPAAELHCFAADDAANRLTREEPLEDVEADVPARG